MFEVQIMKLHKDAIIPTYANPGDAGADLYSCEDVYFPPGHHQLIDTGIAIAIPYGWVGLVHPRSGLAARLGVTVLNAPGTVDAGYRGNIMVNLINHGSEPVTIVKGDRIAQLVFQQVDQATFVPVRELDSTVRGVGGHGSTGGIDGWVQE
jgi:dUTP pyrophosphatase